MGVRRVVAFVDRPRERFEEAAAFWTAVTGTRLSPRRGDDGEFATLLPESGDACVKLQAVDGEGGAHLDLEVDDVRAAVAGAEALGAAVAADHGDWAVLRSPEGEGVLPRRMGGCGAAAARVRRHPPRPGQPRHRARRV